MSDVGLTAFVKARLDEDEQVARAATPGPWSYNPGKVWLDGEAFESFDHSKGEEFVGYGGPSPFRGCVAATGPADHPQSMADAAFIARYDPARALAEVESKRLILREHDEEPCSVCIDDINGCPTRRAFALPYAGHPDYDPAWRNI